LSDFHSNRLHVSYQVVAAAGFGLSTIIVLMTSAYVLIQTSVGRADRVAEEASGIPGVIAADHVTGPYDVIARVEANSLEDVMGSVVRVIQALGGITRTMTCPVAGAE
jgi:DNA-binding Lrp family transcriptional regulator